MERLMRLRQPAAVIVSAALVLHVVLEVGARVAEPREPAELGLLGAAVVDPLLLALLTALLVTCWLGEPTRGARALTVTALVLTGALAVAVVGLGVLATVRMPWPDDDVEIDFYVWLLPSLTVVALALMAQVALLRRPVVRPAPEAVAGPRPAELEPEPEPEPVGPGQNLEPGWDPDQAVGTVWRRAGDAASGTPATDWDGPGPDTGGWGVPAPAAEAPAEPPVRPPT